MKAEYQTLWYYESFTFAVVYFVLCLFMFSQNITMIFDLFGSLFVTILVKF